MDACIILRLETVVYKCVSSAYDSHPDVHVMARADSFSVRQGTKVCIKCKI